MSATGAFAFAGVALTGWLAAGWWMVRRNDERLATSRPGMTREAFVAALSDHGADADIAAEVLDWIAIYYGRETTPNTQDRLKDDICLDPEDMEDFVDEFFGKHGMPRPTIRKPEFLPDYAEMTPTSLATFLTQRRAQASARHAS